MSVETQDHVCGHHHPDYLSNAADAIGRKPNRNHAFGWSSALDPMCYDGDTDRRNSRVVIDACIPFRRKKTFPVIARSSKALDDRIKAKWAADLP